MPTPDLTPVYSSSVQNILEAWVASLGSDTNLSNEIVLPIKEFVQSIKPSADTVGPEKIQPEKPATTTPKITRISISNLRGIREFVLDLPKQNLLIFGANGTGKSSIVDGIEFILTGEIKKLKGRADVNPQDCIPFDAKKQTFIEITFDDSSSLKAVFPPFALDSTNASPPVKRMVFEASRKPFILHRAQLTQFIEDRPANRYISLSALMGMDALDSVVADHNNRVKQAADRNSDAISRQMRAANNLRDLLGVEFKTRNDIVPIINQRLEAVGVKPTTNRDELLTRQQDIFNRSIHRDNLELANQWGTLITNLASAETALENLFTTLTELFGAWQAFLAQSERLTDAPYEQLLHEGRDLIAVGELNNCPLCEEPIRREDILKRLDERLESLHLLTAARQELEEKKTNAVRQLHRSSAAVEALHCEVTGTPGAPPISHEVVCQLNESWEIDLGQNPPKIEAASVYQQHPVIQLFLEQASAAKIYAQEEISRLTPDDSERKLLNLAEFIPQVYGSWGVYIDTTQAATQARAHAEHEKKVFDHLVATRRAGIQSIIHDLEGEFLTLYNQLHPGEGHEAIQILMQGTRGGSAELIAKSKDMQAMHPLGLYSEGHLDSLGLCIFLAFLKRFSNGMRLIILDDVLTSIDAGHRLRVARLLAKEFKDYQLIITTHDELWANELDHIFRNLKLVRMNNWNRNDGATCDEYIRDRWPVYLQRAGQGLCQDAVGNAGRDLEKFMAHMRRNLQLSVPATFDEKYTLKPLYDPFFKWVRGVKIERPDSPNFMTYLNELKDEMDAYWQFRNWSGAHYNEWGATISSAEAVRFIELARDLVEAFECPECHALVQLDGSKKVLRCPYCDPVIMPRVVWVYQPDWIRQTERLASDESKSLELRYTIVFNKVQGAFERLLIDSRRKLHLCVPATPDDVYSTEHLIDAFYEQLDRHPRSEIPDWANLPTLRQELYGFLTPERRWLTIQDLSDAGQASRLFELVTQIVGLLTCSECHNLLELGIDGTYDCPKCNMKSTTVLPAYWSVIELR